jgi:hypothetical protein
VKLPGVALLLAATGVALPAAWQHLGLAPPPSAPAAGLFD